MKGYRDSPSESHSSYRSTPKFDRDDNSFRSCCCHSTTATMIIGVLVILASTCGILASVGNWWHSDYHKTEFLEMDIAVTVAGLSFILALLMIIGLKAEKSSLLIIYLIWQVVCIAGAIVIGAACICGLLLVSQHRFEGSIFDLRPERDDETYLTVKMSIVLALCTISLFGGIYFFTAILKAVKYLKQKGSYERVYRNKSPIQPVGYVPLTSY